MIIIYYIVDFIIYYIIDFIIDYIIIIKESMTDLFII